MSYLLPEVVTIGPVLLPTLRTGLLFFLILGIWLSGWLARRAGRDRGATLALAESTVIAGLVGARLGYGLRHYEVFAEQPLTLLYIWQPGFDPVSGLAVALAWLGWRAWRRPAARALPVLLARGFALPALLIALLVGSLEWSRRHGEGAIAGTLPPVILTDLQGRRVDSQALQGRPVVLNFWASWCGPCRRELPLLNRVAAQYRAAGLAVVGVNVAEPAETVRAFTEQVPIDFPVWLDPGHDTASTRSLHSRLRVRGLPTTYFIDAEGLIRARYIGELSDAYLRIRLRELID